MKKYFSHCTERNIFIQEQQKKGTKNADNNQAILTQATNITDQNYN